MDEIDQFSGGSQSARDKLNRLVENVNALAAMRGDEVFITVRRGPGGSTIALNIDAVMARVPKVALGGGGGFFAVKVEMDGGINGTQSTAATYTYTVRHLEGDLLGTLIPMSKPRDPGSVTYQAGAGGYGIAFYDDGVLVLWDAGETKDTGC